TSDIVAEAAVPLQPGIAGETADLVESRRIPGLRDEPGAGQLRIRFDVPENWRPRHWMAGLVSRQNRRQIETEAVDVHFRYPVAQAVQNQPPHNRLVG